MAQPALSRGPAVKDARETEGRGCRRACELKGGGPGCVSPAEEEGSCREGSRFGTSHRTVGLNTHLGQRRTRRRNRWFPSQQLRVRMLWAASKVSTEAPRQVGVK